MKAHLIFIFIFIIGFLKSTDSDIPQIAENSKENYIFQKGESHLFKFKTYKFLSDRYISLKYFSKIDPNILNFYISEYESPSIYKNDMICLNVFNYNKPCLYKMKSIVNDSKFIYILMICESKTCEFELEITNLKETLISSDDSFMEEFSETKQMVFLNFFQNDFDKIKFERVILSINFLKSDIHEIFEYQQNKIIRSNYFSFTIGDPQIIYVDTKIIVIFNKFDFEKCKKCNFSIFFTSTENALTHFEVHKYLLISDIKLNVENIDYFSNGLNQYAITIPEEEKIKLNDENSKLIFYFGSLSGTEKKIFINGDNPTQNIEQSHFSSSIENYYNEEDIILTKKDFDLKKIKGDKFYIYLVGNSPGLFSLQIKVNNLLIMPLNIGLSDERTIDNLEIQYYKLQIWNLDSEIKIRVVSLYGNVDLYARFCSIYNICDSISSTEIESKKNISFYSENEKFNQIKFNSTCPENQYFCYLIVAVRGFSIISNYSRYGILATKPNTIITLLENVKQEGHIDIHNTIRYKFIFHEDLSDIQSINIKINSDLVVYSTKDIICFQINCTDKKGDAHHPIIYEKNNEFNNFSGIYYIFVQGLKSTNFEIMIDVIKKNNDKNLNQFIILNEGVIHKDSLTKNKKISIFKFMIHGETQTNIDIHLISDRHKFELLIFNDEKIIDEKYYLRKTTENYISLKYIPKINNRFYNLIIQTLNNSPIENDLGFGIMFSTDNTIKTLEKNKLFYDTIKPNTFKFYLFFLGSEENYISISKNVINPKSSKFSLGLYLDKNPYPESTFNSYKLDYNESSKLILKSEEISKLCEMEKSSYHCPIYISIYNKDFEEEVDFSLLVHIRHFAIQIYEGIEQKFVTSTDFDEEDLKAYFIPTLFNNSLDIHLYTFNIEFEVFMSIYDDKNHEALSHLYFIDFPNKTSYQIHSTIKKQHILSILPKNFDFCKPDCIILFDIVFLRNMTEKNFYSDIDIMISSDLVDIHEGKSIVFNLAENQFKYFRYDLKKILITKKNFNGTFLISLTPFYGKGIIVANIAIDPKPEKPDLKKYDFISYGDHIQIKINTILNIIKNNVLSPESLNTIYLIIGIYSNNQDSKFMLNLMLSTDMVLDLMIGNANEINLKADEKRYFEYYNNYEENLKILFNREYGLGSMSVYICDAKTFQSTKFQDCTNKTADNVQFITGTGSCFSELSVEKTKNFCFTCYYIIALIGITDLKGSILISQKKHYINLQEGRKIYDHVDKNELNYYSFSIPESKPTELLLTVFRGDPIIYFYTYYTIKFEESHAIKLSKGNNSYLSLFIPGNYYKNDMNDEKTNKGLFPLVYYISSYYIMVKGNEESEYVISFVNKNEQQLNGGLIHYDTLRQIEEKKYSYSNFDKSINPILSINLDNGDLSHLSIIFKFRPQNDIYDFKFDIEDIHLNESFKTNTSISYQFGNKTGTYIIIIKNLMQNISNFTFYSYNIVVNARDISILPHSVTLKSFIEPNRMRYYEIFIPQKGFLSLEVLECTGSLEILLTKDYHKLIQNDFDEEFKPLLGQSFVNILKVNKGMAYLAFKSGNENTIFDFGAFFYEAHADIPQMRFNVGNQGEINYDFNNEKKKFEISFKPIVCLDCTENELNQTIVKYIMIYGENESEIKNEGKCRISTLNKENKFGYFSQEILVENLIENKKHDYINGIVLKEIDTKFYLMVKVEIINFGGRKNVNLFYENIEIFATSKMFRSRWVFILFNFGVLLILFCCCGFGIYFWKKYKRVAKQLKYEMEDVRNVANLSNLNEGSSNQNQSIEMENKKYVGLD